MTERGSKSSKSFRHGVHPGEHKQMTEGLALERLPIPHEVVLPLSQHLGAPSKPIVEVGEKVFRGQRIADANGFVSVALHASVTGRVTAIEKRHHPTGRLEDAIVIATDLSSPQTLFDEGPVEWQSLPNDQLLRLIQNGGFVGLGGAAFPTHVKLSIPEGKHARFFLVNGAECEPYLTSDHRIMLEWTDSIFLGIRILMKILDSEKTYIGVENNKWDAIRSMRERVPDDLAVEIVPLEAKYPQGAEKMLVKAMLNREVPSGKLPIDSQVLVQNVGTVAGIGDLFAFGQPLIERVVTVTGPGINNPSTLVVPVGAELGQVLEYCGGLKENVRQVLFGGPMMGAPQQYLEVPILKGTSGILCLTDDQVKYRKEYPCIRCATCVDACPVFLNPSELGQLARVRRWDEMVKYHIWDCMECGSCSYVCPSNIPLVQRFRVAKAMLKEKAARDAAAEKEKAEKEKTEKEAAEAETEEKAAAE
ncbi:MAG: electron transport complex subunit RsxC [Candidatus Latescibacterota bacterium]|jgi:electron transport complex protein RnfC